MFTRQDPSPELLDLARAQSGVVSRRQCMDLGLTSHSVDRLLVREWEKLAPGVYSIRPGEATWRSNAWAGVLLGGRDACLGFGAAAHVLGLTDQPDQIEVWVRRSASRDCPGWVFHHDALNRRSRGDLSTTTVEDTVLDLCPRLDVDGIAALVGNAVGGRHTSIEQLRATAQQRKRLGQRRLIYEILGLADDGVHSALERRFVTDVERPHALPIAERQFRVRRGVRADAFYEAFGVVVEFDGQRWHAGRGVWRDLERDNINTTLSLATLRYGWADVVSRPCEMAAQVAAVLQARGWEGSPRACVRCRRAQALA